MALKETHIEGSAGQLLTTATAVLALNYYYGTKHLFRTATDKR